MKQGSFITVNDRNYVVITTVKYGLDNTSCYLCQEVGAEGSLVIWPAATFEKNDLKVNQLNDTIVESVPPVVSSTQVNTNPVMNTAGTSKPTASQVNSEALMEAFFDADSMKEKLDCLRQMKDQVTEHMLSSMAISLDFELSEGDLDEKFYSLDRYLRTRIRFEGGRRP